MTTAKNVIWEIGAKPPISYRFNEATMRCCMFKNLEMSLEISAVVEPITLSSRDHVESMYTAHEEPRL
tara:strand:+ start:361 stop:564 length:204 start_codon:yes stop_codon:yes gene_type:complete